MYYVLCMSCVIVEQLSQTVDHVSPLSSFAASLHLVFSRVSRNALYKCTILTYLLQIILDLTPQFVPDVQGNAKYLSSVSFNS